MRIKDIFLAYLLFIFAISINVLGGLAYIKWFTILPSYFQICLGILGISFLIIQLVIIVFFINKGFREYFDWS